MNGNNHVHNDYHNDYHDDGLDHVDQHRNHRGQKIPESLIKIFGLREGYHSAVSSTV